jgi:hypothetical protein
MKDIFALCIASLLIILLIKDGRKTVNRKTRKNLKYDEFNDRPIMSWTDRDPLNPIDTDW